MLVSFLFCFKKKKSKQSLFTIHISIDNRKIYTHWVFSLKIFQKNFFAILDSGKHTHTHSGMIFNGQCLFSYQMEKILWNEKNEKMTLIMIKIDLHCINLNPKWKKKEILSISIFILSKNLSSFLPCKRKKWWNFCFFFSGNTFFAWLDFFSLALRRFNWNLLFFIFASRKFVLRHWILFFFAVWSRIKENFICFKCFFFRCCDLQA